MNPRRKGPRAPNRSFADIQAEAFSEQLGDKAKRIDHLATTINQPSVRFSKLSGDSDPRLAMTLYKEAMEAFQKHWSNELLLEDFAFQTGLRWLASMYFFLGGADFNKRLAVRVRVMESTAWRWLSGHSAPAANLRLHIIAEAESMVGELSKCRANGEPLYVVVQREEISLTS